MKSGLLQDPQPSLSGRRFRRFVSAVEALSASSQYFICAVFIAVIFIIDYATGPEVAISIFYLIPTSLLAWHRGFKAACVGVAICGFACLAADQLNGHRYSHGAIQYWNALVRAAFFFIVAYILIQMRRAVDEEKRLARTDTLTGVGNSRWFMEIAGAEVARQRRYGHPLTIAFLDCDNFKQVNDRLGHAEGDELLKRIAVTIHTTLREVDIVARLGGDEFAILLPESNASAAEFVESKLRAGLQRVVMSSNVTFSMGIVTWYEPPKDVQALISSADQAMYAAKNAGKDTSRHQVMGQALLRTAEGH